MSYFSENQISKMVQCIKEIKAETSKCAANRVNVSEILHKYGVHLNTSAVIQSMGHLTKIKNGLYRWNTKRLDISPHFATKVMQESEKRAEGYHSSSKIVEKIQELNFPELSVSAIIERNEELKKRKQQLLESINIDNLKKENEILEIEISELEKIANQ